MRDKRTLLLLAMLSTIIPFSVYLLTVAPSVIFFDAGELITSSFLLAQGHPPGYPLYVIMGKLATFFPFGNVAYRLNVMAALFSSLANLTVFLITYQIIKGLQVPDPLEEYKGLVSFITAITFAFSYDHWNQAVIAEVYPLNTFITGLLIYLLLLWRENETEKRRNWETERNAADSRLLYLVSFLFGLGLGNHHTLLVILPVLFLVIAVTSQRLLFDAKAWGLSMTLFVLGLSVYLFLPLRAMQGPELNWGDPDSISRFKWVIFREGYPRGGIYRPLQLFWAQLKTINIVHGFTVAGFAFGCLGMIACLKKRWFEVMITMVIFLVLSVGIVIYGNPSEETVFLIESFHTPSYMIFSVWIGMGFFFTLTLACRSAGKLFEPGKARVGTSLLTAVLPIYLLVHFYPSNDRHKDYIAYDYAQNELASMPSNSILFTWGDSGAFPLWYLQIVERYQPGLLLVHTPHLSTKWYIDGLPDTVRKGQLRRIEKDDLYAESAFAVMLRENYGKYPLFIDYSTRYSVPVEDYISVPQGLIYEISTNASKMTDTGLWERYAMRDIYRNDPYRDLDTEKAVSIYANTLFDGGNHLLLLGYSKKAAVQFGEAVKINPQLELQVRNIMPGVSTISEGRP